MYMCIYVHMNVNKVVYVPLLCMYTTSSYIMDECHCITRKVFLEYQLPGNILVKF